MSGSSTSGGGTTPPYPSPSLHVIGGAPGERRPRASAASDSDSSVAHTSGADATNNIDSNAGAAAANFYASGNSRIALSRGATPLLPSTVHNNEYMYAMDARDNIRDLSGSNSLSSVAFEDSQKRSYHPIEFVMGDASTGNLAESLESGRLLRHPSESSAGGVLSAGPSSTGQNSFVATPELGAMSMSPLLPRPITYGLGPLEATSTAAGHPLPPSPLASTAAGARAPMALSGSLPSMHGAGFPDIPKQQLPRIPSKNSVASTVTTVDKSPLDPSMTARGATPSRSTAPSLNMSRFPTLLQSPNSSIDTHRPATPTPFSEVQRYAEGRASAFPTQRLPNPPDRPHSHLLLEAGLADSRRSANETAGGRSSVRSTPTAARLSLPPSPTKASAYQTPLALLASSSSGGGSSSSSSHHKSSLAAEEVQHPHTPPVSGVSSLKQMCAENAPPSRTPEGSESGTPSIPQPPPPPPPPSVFPPLRSQAAEAARPVPVPPPHPSPSSSSSSRSASSHSAAPSDRKKRRPSPPPVALPVTDLAHLAPLIQQTDYHKSDVKEIACSAAFTMGDVTATMVKLRLLRHQLLGRAEPLPPIQASAIRAGRVKALKTLLATNTGSPAAATASAAEVAPPPRAVDVSDLHDTMVVFDNVLLAVTFALWGSVAHYNELVSGLLHYCGPDVAKRGPAKKEKGEEGKGERDAGDAELSAAPPLTSATSRGRLNVPFSSVLRFLNHCGVDVVVVSANRKAASSFCAKRQQVHRRQRRDSDARRADAPPADTQPPQQMDGEQGKESAILHTTAPLRRVLIALSFDTKQGVWCPLTLSRPIRPVAAAWHEYRRRTRQRERQTQRRERRHAEAQAAAAAAKAAVQAKLEAWQQRMHDFCQMETPAAVAAAAAAAQQEATEVVVPHNGETTTDDGSSPLPPKPAARLPFDGVLYPNLVQTDVGFNVMLKQGLHPLFGVARLRLVVGVPQGIVAFLFGLAFIIYVVKTTAVCFYDLTAGQCAVIGGGTLASTSSSGSPGSGDSSSSVRNASCFTILSGGALDDFASNLPRRFLFGQAVSPGNCLIVCICCSFTAFLDSALIAFFATRYLALGGVRPCFHYILQAVQIALGAITCAFSAYLVFCFHARRHTMSCAALQEADATLCAARLRSCGGRYVYAAHSALSGANVTLVLSIVYLILCVLQWLVSFLPAVPSPGQQDAIPTATPDTYAFHPSLFAPDGPTPQEIARLRHVMQPPLRRDLEQCVQQHDRLLTASTTIGEMMQANRAQSLKQMKLNEQRRQRRVRPFTKQQTGRHGAALSGGGGADVSRRELRKRRRYLAWGGDTADDQHSNSDTESTQSSASATASAAARDRTAVLAPRLVQRVGEIGAKVRARQSETMRRQPPNPFLAAATASATSAEEAASRAKPGERLGRQASTLRRTASSLRRVVVVSDEEDSAFGGGAAAAASDDESRDNKERRVPASSAAEGKTAPPAAEAAVSPSSPLSAFAAERSSLVRPHTSSFHLPLSAPPPPSLPRPAAPVLTAKSSFARSQSPEMRTKTSLQSSHFSQLARPVGAARAPVVAPSVELEIDNIVTRLRGVQQL